MVIRDTTFDVYTKPLKKLFPKGEYWEKLLSDENSDVSLICKARAMSLAKFRERIKQLQRESFPDIAKETIGDWERIYFGYENEALNLEQRRSLLRVQKSGGVNIDTIKTIAEAYGGAIYKWELPYKPAAFGHAQFGRDYMSSIAGMWVVFIHASVPDETKNDFEAAIRRAVLANQTIFFVYGD